MIAYLEFLNMPTRVCLIVIGCFFVIQMIGELLEFEGKVVPEFIKIRKFFARRKAEKKETTQTLKEVKVLLIEVNRITNHLSDVTNALNANTKLTEEMFVQNSRDRIIDFAAKVADKAVPVSREEFNRVFKVYKRYESFLEEHGLTNGEIDINYSIIEDGYKYRLATHTFVEDVRDM